eukprot:CAMPEP_0185765388 /NCGR_PEP_ID=MMETSP1174-20130828/28860_1 /TAXON_ID=35687 /ORGANISM="Dictyocha speculum, Strain CCMP1381" /LENGTH=271 /DNA_ID=CAMNT_0028448485 /DNA_START=14 /DNA_END=829 /DNA_ORIENTATION=+
MMLKQVFSAVSPVLKSCGKALDSAGAALEVARIVETPVVSTVKMPFKGVTPSTTNAGVKAFVAPNATVIGDVEIGPGSSVWYGASVRGDVHSIKVGRSSSIGENVTVHVAKIAGDFPTCVGDQVTVGANAILHACTVENQVVIGAGAVVLDGATVKSNAVVAPGAVVSPGKVVGSGELWSGTPAKFLRNLTPEEIDGIAASAAETEEMAKLHALECDKSYQQIAADLDDFEDNEVRHPDYWQKPEGDDSTNVLGQGSPGMIFNNQLQRGGH